jgi:hypothetical protein
MPSYTFPITICGVGRSPNEAWGHALKVFAADPGPAPEQYQINAHADEEFSPEEIAMGMKWVADYKQTVCWPTDHRISLSEELDLRMWSEFIPNGLQTFAALFRTENRQPTGPSLLIYQENYLDEL